MFVNLLIEHPNRSLGPPCRELESSRQKERKVHSRNTDLSVSAINNRTRGHVQYHGNVTYSGFEDVRVRFMRLPIVVESQDKIEVQIRRAIHAMLVAVGITLKRVTGYQVLANGEE
jgi:hypothetical protein